MNTFDDDTELGFFEEPRRPQRHERRRPRAQRGGSRPPAPPPGAVALTRLAGLVALAIAVVIGLVFWVGSCQGQSKHDEYASYVARVLPLAQDSARVGTQLASVLGAANLSTSGLEARLQSWWHEEQLDYAAAQRIQPPGPLQSAHDQVLDAFQLRALGLAGLADTLEQARSKSPAPSTATVASELAGQAQLLTASDIVWAQLYRLSATQVLSRQGVTGVIIPASQFVTNADIVSARSFSIVYQRLGTATTGGGTPSGLHGSALIGTQAIEGNNKTVTLSTSTSAPATISVSSALVIRVTFEDSGNYPEVQIPVTLKVVVSGESVYSKTQTVTQILAHQQQSVDFSSLQVPTAAFGREAKISVSIAKVPGEVRLDNNAATYPVFFSLAPS
ncbi:MAG TPA: hypothetical protein VKR79_00645 [Gaiellaceae bacterium]|nr:hypothetical protein [Gaiellaceae bacterium]